MERVPCLRSQRELLANRESSGDSLSRPGKQELKLGHFNKAPTVFVPQLCRKSETRSGNHDSQELGCWAREQGFGLGLGLGALDLDLAISGQGFIWVQGSGAITEAPNLRCAARRGASGDPAQPDRKRPSKAPPKPIKGLVYPYSSTSHQASGLGLRISRCRACGLGLRVSEIWVGSWHAACSCLEFVHPELLA